jgi:hypothetical protein
MCFRIHPKRLLFVIALAFAGLLASAKPATAAVNTLTSIADGDQILNHFKAVYQGNVTCSSVETVVLWVKIVTPIGADGSADYLVREDVNPLIWDYHGQSDSYYQQGTPQECYTVASLSPGWTADSNHITWTP